MQITISALAKHITEWSCRKSLVTHKDRIIIQYGLQLTFENVTKMVILLLIGALLHCTLETIIIFVSFSSVRSQAGGIHAKTSLGCTAFMIGVWTVSLKVSQLVTIPIYILILLSGACNLLIYLFAPNGSETCSLLDEKSKKRKKYFAYLVINFLFLISLLPQVRELIAVPITIESLSLLAYQISIKRKESEHEGN